jgi:hypothetical protein
MLARKHTRFAENITIPQTDELIGHDVGVAFAEIVVLAVPEFLFK